ncbi:MAG: hypothetical protein KIT17_00720 [Rubrivivax sp.]|nr:hypothetical protein [Rubrivivax sp.]
MKLTPFRRVDEHSFGLTPEELVARRGPPHARRRNAVALDELDYGDVVFRFQASGRLEEVTRRAPVLHLCGGPSDVAVPFTSLAGFVGGQDPEAFERAGFVVSPRFGLAFAPGSPDWVTALARHCIATWRAL